MSPDEWVRTRDEDLEHRRCRIQEFRRWTRVVLEHEREHLSRSLSQQAALLSPEANRGILHDITDIDWCLSQLGLKGE